MKQSKEDIEKYGRAYCIHCGLLSNEDDKVCDNGEFGERKKRIRLKHTWFYDKSK